MLQAFFNWCMYISNKLWGFKIASVVSAGFLLGFLIFFGFAVKTILDAEQASKNTAKILAVIGETQRAIEEAEHAGRLAVFDTNLRHNLLEKRSMARDQIEVLLNTVRANPTLFNQVQQLGHITQNRFAAQDDQQQPENAQAMMVSKTVFNAVVSSSRLLQNQLSIIRSTEVDSLLTLEESRRNTQWTMITGMLVCMSTSIAISGIMFFLLWKELVLRINLTESIRELNELPEKMVSEDVFKEMLRMLDCGEQASKISR